jgi:hypothetical protein
MTDDTRSPLSGYTAAELAAEVERMGHTPDRDELRSLLVRYFVGPITDAHLDRILTELARAKKNTFGDLLSLHESIERLTYLGWAWREEVFANHRTPSDTDLMLLLAHKMWAGNDFRRRTGDTLEFSQPKLYCPATVVGTWEQLEPIQRAHTPVLWHFGSDGVLRTTSPDGPPDNYRRWCVHREYGWPQPRFSIDVMLASFYGSWTLQCTQSGEEISAVNLVPMAHVHYRFRRVG